MKKLLTLVALLTCFLGAKAEWVQDYKIDYSTYTGFPFYVMGYVPEWVDGVMTDYGANYKYVTLDNEDGETSDVTVKTNNGTEYYRIEVDGSWHQYFIADGIPTELDGAYTVKAMVRASVASTVHVNMGWGWGDGQQVGADVFIGEEWEEVEWDYTGIGGTSCNLVAQPGTNTATIEWKYVIVSHNQKESRPTEWVELLTNGDAEKPWGDLADIRFNDQENNFKVCAWSKEKGRNMNENDGWDPFPADIEEVDGSHVFVCHGQVADTEGDASAWDNQFWIQAPKLLKVGTQFKIHFHYKASQTVKTNTQYHKQNPSDYVHWQAIGDVTFTTEWQDFDGQFTVPDAANPAWSIAFNLNPEVKDAVNFYFDDLSIALMKLDEGLFVAGSNADTGLEYDLDNAVEFVQDDDLMVATIGTVGKEDSWVKEVMISTTRGNDQAFKGATLKPTGTVVDDPDTWLDYTESSLAKIKLPAAGVWKISIDTEGKQMNFVKLEGEATKQPIEINPNPTEVVVHGLERDELKTDDNPDATGYPWDNQFFIVANRALSAGEVTVIKFQYKGSVEAKTTTQDHIEPGAYLHWDAIGDVNFTTEWQEFEKTFTVPSAADGMQSIAFNMAEIKEACDYYIKDIVWKLEDNTESLINQTGAENFYVKEGAGTSPYIFGTDAGIHSVALDNRVSTAIYNLAGQRVSKDYKGIVVKGGRKYLAK